MPRAAPPLLLLLLALAQRRACLPGPATAAPPAPDPCLSQPCRNNGTCFPAAPRRLPPAAAYRCACPPGVSGASCQFISDPCASNPCHHGNCSTSGDGYLCACSEGYEGANCERSRHSPSLPKQAEASSPRQSRPVTSTLEPDIILPHSRATVTLPTWQPRAGQKVVDLKWDDIEILPDVACGNASSNTSAGGRLVSFEVPQNTSIKIRQDATASLILLWKVTTAGFKQCSLIDGRSVTLLQALGGLVLPDEMLALGNNYFIGNNAWHLGTPTGTCIASFIQGCCKCLRLRFKIYFITGNVVSLLRKQCI